jgi:DNA polymerase-3 subunit epsilon
MKNYNYWGSDGEPPENLKTKRQLSDMGLSPRDPVGIIETRKYTIKLYDVNDPKSVKTKRKVSAAQRSHLEDLAKMNKLRADYKYWSKYFAPRNLEYNESIQASRDLLQKEDCVILDTETTGLYDAEIVEISMIDMNGKTLMNQLVNPGIAIPQEVINIHGINDSMVAAQPTILELWDEITKIVSDKHLLIYNASFDLGILKGIQYRNKLIKLNYSACTCIMCLYAVFNQEWSEYHKDYKWQPLMGGHRALGDCIATLDVIKEMAVADFYGIPDEYQELAAYRWGDSFAEYIKTNVIII